MKRSTERLLTTHVGSLARPHELLELMKAVVAGEPYDQDAFANLARNAVIEVVRQQADCGVDVVSDGEQSKAGFYGYVKERLSGCRWATSCTCCCASMRGPIPLKPLIRATNTSGTYGRR